jgi:hypothetical protein
MVLHIDLGNQSLTSWMRENKYFIHSELIRYAETLIENSLDEVQALMLSNLSDNVSESEFFKYGISDKQYLNAAHASIIQQDSSGNWIWSGRSFGIKGNGSYSIHLKPGTYREHYYRIGLMLTYQSEIY